MSELRQDPTTKEWVIIAIERRKRPEDFSRGREVKKEARAAKKCPFCPGNEALTPPEVLAYRTFGSEANKPGWWVRAIPNKFPALVPKGSLEREEKGTFFTVMEGVGIHEVIIETPEHDKTIGLLSDKQAEDIFLVYRDRYLTLSGDPRFKLIIIFKNHGEAAGTSLEHPHSQVIATPVVPNRIRQRLVEAMAYYDMRGKCVYCDMVKKELEMKERVVLESDRFLVFEPFASRSPFETWVVPKRHNASFAYASIEETKELAQVMNRVMAKLHKCLVDPDYNYIVHSAPTEVATVGSYHWHIQVLPKVTITAGFELGSGIYINVALPEECAQFLRDTKV